MRRLPVLIFSLSLFLGAIQPFAQKKPKLRPQPSPTPPIESKSEGQEPVRVFTEEVRLSVAATDQYGHYDPSLEVDDVLVAAGGILPDEDIPAIKAMGIQGCFGPGTSTDEIIKFVQDNIHADRLTTEV